MQLFLKELRRELQINNCEFFVSSFEEVELFLEKGQAEIAIAGKPLETWSTIYPRKVGEYKSFAHILSLVAKGKDIFFIDQFHEDAKDSSDAAKIIQMFHLATAGISIPKTYYATTYSDYQLKNAVAYLGLPIVIKECHTSQGAGVFLAKDSASLKKIIHERLSVGEKKEIFLQEFISNNYEYRFLVTGNAVAVAEKKIRAKTEEFRNNVHLGATEEFLALSTINKKFSKEALLAAKITRVQIAGVDVVEGKNGQPVILEVNSCPALTLDSKISNEINQLAKYLSTCETRKK